MYCEKFYIRGRYTEYTVYRLVYCIMSVRRYLHNLDHEQRNPPPPPPPPLITS